MRVRTVLCVVVCVCIVIDVFFVKSFKIVAVGLIVHERSEKRANAPSSAMESNRSLGCEFGVPGIGTGNNKVS